MTAHDSSQIICLTETWLTHHVRDNTIFFPAYELHRSERKPNAKAILDMEELSWAYDPNWIRINRTEAQWGFCSSHTIGLKTET